MTEDPRNPELDSVDRSGYPLQMAIAHAVEAGKAAHGWRVLYEEHAWKHAGGEQGYIDIVLEHYHMQVVLVVECKRIQNRGWVFLPTNGNAQLRRIAKGLRVQRRNNVVVESVSGWSDVTLDPRTPEAAFCVMPKDARDPTIDRVGAELVLAAEALETEERAYLDRRSGDSTRVYFPVVVTTAQLKICSFDPRRISLSDGLVPPDAEVSVVDCVRFTKQLSTEPGVRGGMLTLAQIMTFGNEAGAIASSKRRTVFVVHAERLNDFLDQFVADIR